MSYDAEKRAEDMINKLRKLKGLCPMTPAEADAVHDASPAIPMTQDEIRSIVECVKSGELGSRRPVPARENQAKESVSVKKEVLQLNSCDWSEWVQSFPLKEMRNLRFSLPAASSDLDVLLKFFGLCSPESWQSAWRATSVAYRQTSIFETREQAIAAWIRETEIVASGLELAKFDEWRLRSSLGALRQLTRKPADQIMDPLQSICARAGVAVVLVPALSHTGISGCARWLNETRALVGLTLRYKTEDQLWFTFFHELGHILLHRHVRSFVVDNAAKDLTDNVVDPEMEQFEVEANRFAADTLIPPKALGEFVRGQTFTSESIHDFAAAIGVSPGIVVGRLQHDGILEHWQGNTLKQNLDYGFAHEE